MYLSPSINPLPFLLHLKTLASSLPTEGFSAKTNILLICCFLSNFDFVSTKFYYNTNIKNKTRDALKHL
ncbi:hypothetical protein D3C76_1124130 [compost metagenome]